MTHAPLHARIGEHAQPFLVATPFNRPHADACPLGVATRWFIDPLASASAPFLFQLQRLDRLTFGPEGMPMARWIFMNMAELPGFVYGFAIDVDALDATERRDLEVPDGYRGPVPISMYIAIPTRRPGVWFGHNLASLNSLLPARALAGLGTLTKVLGLAAFRAELAMGATQWQSRALFVHTRLGPLRLHTAWTPAHSIVASLTYSWPVDRAVLAALADGARPSLPVMAPTAWLDDDDTDGMQALQRGLEAGDEVWIVGRPEGPTARGGRRLPLVVRPHTE